MYLFNKFINLSLLDVSIIMNITMLDAIFGLSISGQNCQGVFHCLPSWIVLLFCSICVSVAKYVMSQKLAHRILEDLLIWSDKEYWLACESPGRESAVPTTSLLLPHIGSNQLWLESTTMLPWQPLRLVPLPTGPQRWLSHDLPHNNPNLFHFTFACEQTQWWCS